MNTGPGEIAGQVVQALEVADDSMAGHPAKVAGVVLIAPGSSTAEQGELARSLAGSFRSHMVAAVESAVHRALLELGSGRDR